MLSSELLRIPKKPVRALLSIYTALAGIIGLMLTAGAAFLIEHLDDHIKSTEQVESILGLPVMGLITETVNSSIKQNVESQSNG